MALIVPSEHTCTCTGPRLTSHEIALLQDADALADMIVRPKRLSFAACEIVMERIKGAGIQYTELSNCLLKPVGCEPVLGEGLPLATLERQLLSDAGALRAPSADEEGADDAAMLAEMFGDDCHVLDLARLGASAAALYRAAYDEILAEMAECAEGGAAPEAAPEAAPGPARED